MLTPQHNSAPISRRITVPEIAEQFGVAQGKVITWIGRGELRAIDCSETGTGGPRWRVLPEDLAAFEAKRANRHPEQAEVEGGR